MSISVRCRRCDRSLKVKDDYAGQTVKCPGCQSTLKVPVLEEEPDDFDEIVEEDRPRPKSKRKTSSGELPVWVGYLTRFWFLAVPILVIPIAFFSGVSGGMIGLGTAVIGVLYMIVGFIPAILVAPVYSLVPLVRMMTPQKERERIWKQQAPHYAVFAKGLLILFLGGASAYLSMVVGDWARSSGWRPAAAARQAEPDFHRPPAAGPGQVAPWNAAGAGQPSQPAAGAPNIASVPSNPTPSFPAERRPPLIPTMPGQAVMVNQSGQWIAARVDVIYSNNTVDVTLVTRQVVRGVHFSELSAMTVTDVAMNGGPKPGPDAPSPSPPKAEPATPPQNVPQQPSAPFQISGQDFQFNLEAQRSFSQRFHGPAKVGDTMVLEVIGYRLGTCFGGKDRIYSTDTEISVAAVHAGLLKEGERGRIKITMVKSLPSYPSLSQNGVVSSNWPDTWPAIQISKVE